MNKKIIALVAALFVATSAQAGIEVYDRSYHQTHQTISLEALNITALANALKETNFNEAFTKEKNFQQNIQLAVLTGSGAVVATFLGCVFAEWLQEFKVRKAEKAKLIARLQCETREVRATCYTA